MGVGGFVWHLHHSCQCHQFSPINLHNCQFDGKFKNNIIIFFRENARRKFKMKKTRLSKMTIVSSSRNQKGAKEISIICDIRLVKFQKGSRKNLENFTFLKTQNHRMVGGRKIST